MRTVSERIPNNLKTLVNGLSIIQTCLAIVDCFVGDFAANLCGHNASAPLDRGRGDRKWILPVLCRLPYMLFPESFRIPKLLGLAELQGDPFAGLGTHYTLPRLFFFDLLRALAHPEKILFGIFGYFESKSFAALQLIPEFPQVS